MSAANYAVSRRAVSPHSRPVIAAPGLKVVPSPAPARGLFTTVITCLLIFVASITLAFYLNTRMVQGAYELKTIKVELSKVEARMDTLQGDVVGLSTPDRLRENATKLGMVPATEWRHIDVASGAIAGNNKK
ncbi:hypothetical protein JOD55_001428 [Arcanobacterium pluranimalium]|uniref:hypothetical protein n=1 Tax=Arcanobacterium pluranimalium TaxID=108028 RepID=UPI0019566A6B|nr:hypothetical protein [Arcanobacterium pluranimalium]MBM7825601.1 hypothetical protein [Arcanobacterium pluranimalium]